MRFALSLLVALIALLPRVLNLGEFVTIDEVGAWMPRSAYFLAALANGNFAATAMSAHPGITTAWLGAIGILLHQLLAGWALISPDDFAARLALMQLPLALVHSLAIVAGYWLLRRLFAPALALLAALLWACDPFVVGFNRILHVDGLMGSFATLSLLAGCVYWLRERRRQFLLVAGVCAALAVLSKSPAVVLGPTLLGIATFAAWQSARAEGMWPWRRELVALVLCALVALFTALLVWPALWADPAGAFARFTASVSEEGGEPHQSGNFFMGVAVEAPGPLFYPVALALRLTPLALLGLVLLALFWRRHAAHERAVLAAIAWFTILFVAELSLFPKKFDRYLVPAFPALAILAAAGWWATLATLQQARLRIACLAGVALLAATNLAWWHPYGLLAYNQLLGGTPRAAEVLHMGWGEGMQLVAAWLNKQPDSREVATVSTTVATLRPYLQPGVGTLLPPAGDSLPAEVGYAVLYMRSLQDGDLDPRLQQIAGNQPPIHTVWLHGVPYAQIYQVVPQPVERTSASFGEAIQLLGYTRREAAANQLALTLFWQARSAAPTVSLFAHLVGPDGQRVAQVDLPELSAGWAASRYYLTQLQLPLPAELAPGDYQLLIGFYDPQSFARLPISGATAADPAIAGPDALRLIELTFPQP
jgi:4-amino-4-deoxy-L-arabinose transferase-like glycosyltransferase